MPRRVVVAMSDQKLAEIDTIFATQFGMPVLDNGERCIGVVSKKDWPWPPTGCDSWENPFGWCTWKYHSFCHAWSVNLFTERCLSLWLPVWGGSVNRSPPQKDDGSRTNPVYLLL